MGETGSTRGRCRQTSTVKTDHEGGETPVDCLLCPTRGGTAGTARAWCSLRTAGTMARGGDAGRPRQYKADHEGGETSADCLFVSDARMKPGMRGVKAAGLRAPSKPLLHCGRNNDREVKHTRIVKVTVLL